MSLPSVAKILTEHVSLEVESIDRMYLNVYIPELQRDKGVVGFFRSHLGYAFASSALMEPISKGFVNSMGQFAKDREVPVVTFEKWQRKDDVANEHRAAVAAVRAGLPAKIADI